MWQNKRSDLKFKHPPILDYLHRFLEVSIFFPYREVSGEKQRHGSRRASVLHIKIQNVKLQYKDFLVSPGYLKLELRVIGDTHW